ncbi:MAG: YfhO family protein, partial [Butyrivibrio sp.]|nr:YfhO family protein [Butyrivibrio sp.]
VRNGDFLWNWNVDLGGSMAGDFSFYLWGSPFFWLTVPFPEDAIPYLMPILMALKYAVAGTCAYLYIRPYVKKYSYAMVGGYLYAFCGFNACNIVFNHFTDSVAFFPLYLLFFERLMTRSAFDEGGKLLPSGKAFLRFAIMSAFMAIVNYYFFFGQALFLVIYFCVRFIRESEVKVVVIRLLRAFCGGLLGVLIAGFFLMQAFAGLKGNTRLDNFVTGYNMLIYPSEKMIWDIIKSLAMLPDIIGKGTLFYTTTVKNASLAAYIPMFGITGVVAFFMIYKKKNWEKTLMWVFLVIAMIPVFNSAFSLFNTSYYARWFYMPVLFMCLMTSQSLQNGPSLELRKGAISAVCFFLLFVLIYLLPSTNDEGKVVFFNMSDNNSIFVRDMLWTAILLLLLTITVFVLMNRKLKELYLILVTIMACIISTYVPVKNGSSIISDRGKQKWQEQMLTNTVQVDMSDFSRGEVDSTSTNYDMVWGIPSIHCFLSTVPSEIFDFLHGAAGITRTVETNLPVERCGIRALVSGRYYFENADISKNRVFYNQEGTDGYEYLDTQNGFDIFENMNFIPMGFTFDSYISESQWEKLEASEHDYDLVRVLILPDDVAAMIKGESTMSEMTASELEENPLSYLWFTQACSERAMTSCTRFETDTNGFSAT